jgi:hypothetical protein
MEEEEQKAYKNPVVYLRKSNKGQHLYCFNVEGCLGEETGSLVMNISDVSAVISGHMEWCKVSVLPPSKEDAESRE